METVCGLILTYNRKDLVKKAIMALAEQTYKLEKIIIVNNASSDGTDKVLANLKQIFPENFIFIINLPDNRGASGGFSEGMRYFLDHTNSNWLWLMDDDALPEKNALLKMLNFYKNFPAQKKNKIGILQNERILDEDEFKKRQMLPVVLRGKRLWRATFEGYLIKRSVIEKIGLPRADFFIYSDDIEYTWRAIAAGFRVYRVLGSYICHRDWAKLKRIRRGLVSKPDIPSWKLYYRFRNCFLIFEKSFFLRLVLKFLLSLDAILWSYVKTENNYFAKRGIEDGFMLISGKIIDPLHLPSISVQDNLSLFKNKESEVN